MAKPNPRRMIERVYSAFSKAHDDLNLRNSLLVQAIGMMDPICGSLQRLQQQNPGQKYLPEDALKLWNIAGKCRARALGTTFPEEKETSLRMALKYMERFAASLHPPKLEDYIAKLEAKQNRTTSRKASGKPRASKPATGGVLPGLELPPIGPDGLPAWKPGTSIRICADVLVKYPSITLEDATNEIKPQIKSSNPEGRIKLAANILVRLGILYRIKINGKVGYEKVQK